VFGASDGNPGTFASLTLSDIPGVDTTGASSPLAASVMDLGVTVSGPPDALDPCTSADYVFTVANNGPDTAIGAVATFPVAASTTFQALAAPSGWSCTTPAVGGTDSVTCSHPALLAGSSASFTLTVRVDCGAAPGTVLSIAGSVTTASTDTWSPNNATATSNLLGAPLFVVTRAALRGLRVRPAEGLVEFATGWQQGTRGFHLYATDDPRGRQGLVRLDADLVEAPQADSQTPILYSVRTASFASRYVVIEELERSGKVNRLGPFAVADQRLERLLARVEQRLERTGARDTALSSRLRVRGLARREARRRDGVPFRRVERRPVLVPGSLKISTEGAGIATVRRADLAGLGLPPGLPLSRCTLTNAGRAVTFRVADAGRPEEALVFAADALETAYTSRNVYVLTWSGPTPTTAVALTREGDPRRAGFERVDRPALYVASVPRGTDPWLWDQLVPDYSWPYEWDPGAGRFDLPGWPAGAPPVPVRLRFQGMTEHRHHADVWLNGESLGRVAFDGAGWGYLDAVAASLLPTGNELRIEYSTDEGDPNAYVYLDYFEAARPAGYAPPAAQTTLAPFDDSLPGLTADYVIVTHPDFAAQAERLALAKRRQGLRVVVTDVFAVYDRWSGGIPEANAVAELLRRLRAGGGPRFVLLLGDDSFDPDDRAGVGARTFVPSLMGWDGVFGRVASENRYADLDGDGRPELAIGRLPARTVEEAQALVAKVEEQQARLAAGFGRQLFAVDDTGDDGFDFAAEARVLAARLPEGAAAGFADLSRGIGPAREELLAGLARGASFLHYFGHGGPQTWADEGLLTLEDAASLPGAGSIVLSWTCLAQFYQYAFGPSVNEGLLLSPTGGALAAFGPAGITEAGTQAALYERLYAELAAGHTTLGDAIRRAKARAVAEDPRARPVVEGFNLLGDPALVIE
jgi:hypothetical protein